jgi:hypothetical protein
MAAERGAFIDQSQSFNVHMVEPTFAKLTSLHFHCWRKVGLLPPFPLLTSLTTKYTIRVGG